MYKQLKFSGGNNMKKITMFVLIILILAAGFLPSVYAFNVDSKAYILIENSSGRVLSEMNADERLAPASLTKIMVLLLIAEEVNAGRLCLSEEVVTSSHASSRDGSVIWLEPGEVMSAADLVKSVVISSANDATVALAEHIAGSEEEFVKLMNRKAYTLKMSNTNFTNTVGYDHPEHYTTARDVAAMSRALMREENYAVFAEHMLTRLCSVRTGTARETQLLNTNNLITYYKGIEGIKTGTTDNAGFCLSASAFRNDMRLIGVVLGCKDNYDRVDLSEKLLDYGFAGYELHIPDSEIQLEPLLISGGVKRDLEITRLDSPPVVIPKGIADSLEYEIYLPQKVTAPIIRNQPVGTITAVLDGEVVYESYIVAAQSVQKLTFWRVLAAMVRGFFGH
jgi:D-alanyl-D-alanine carboxypeptidase (penicillin-binding protein 5/6)